MLGILRIIAGKVIIFLDRIFSPSVQNRSIEAQKMIDLKMSNQVLYQFEHCPFCIKVRRAAKRLNIKVELRDAKNDSKAKEELISGGGEYQAPCLRIKQGDGSYQWLYESSDIISFWEALIDTSTESPAKHFQSQNP
jgi:glutaredoxin